MRATLLLLTAVAQLSCGGPPPPDLEADLERPPPISAQPTSSWPDAADLGVVVSSEVVATEAPPPPPDFAR